MISWLSPAKINLHLRVLGRRKDGYHNIATLMQQISLYDELEFSPREKEIVVRCPEGTLPENEENIVFRAAETLLTHSNCRAGVEITIRKNIPIAAGLGGGSSDAATTLMALNDIFSLRLSRSKLMRIGANLGADVPFFIFGPCAWAFGIGNRLKKPPLFLPSLWFVLLNPPLQISTKTVYEKLNLRLTNETINYSIPRFYTVADIVGGLCNDLEGVTLNLHPHLQHLKDLLVRHGALGTLMSGSGPTIFGIFSDEEGATRTAVALQGAGPWSVFTAHSVQRAAPSCSTWERCCRAA